MLTDLIFRQFSSRTVHDLVHLLDYIGGSGRAGRRRVRLAVATTMPDDTIDARFAFLFSHRDFAEIQPKREHTGHRTVDVLDAESQAKSVIFADFEPQQVNVSVRSSIRPSAQESGKQLTPWSYCSRHTGHNNVQDGNTDFPACETSKAQGSANPVRQTIALWY